MNSSPNEADQAEILKWTPKLPLFAQLCVRPHFIKEKRRRAGSKAQGQRYEAQVQAVLAEIFGSSYIPGPWFKFRYSPAERFRYCQPDGLLFSVPSRRITVVEIKLRHTPAAFEQLYTRYLPVVTKAFGGEGKGPRVWKFCLTEVVRWYEPGIKFPVPVRLTPDIAQTRPGEVTVHICNPDRREFKNRFPELAL